jgi:hypothetical protein
MPYSNIDSPKKYFDTKLYTGTGSTQSISGLSFKPDWLWIKSRSTTGNGRVHDVIRGVDKQLYTSLTNAEFTYSPNTGVTSFNTDGFSLGSDIGQNENGTTYASWNWLASNTTASNTSGTITSTVSANTTSGFSIVSFTHLNSVGTIGHGLGVAPSMIILKKRGTGVDNWYVYHKNVGNNKYMYLDLTDAPATYALWNNTTPTSSVFSIGTWSATSSGSTFIAYCFAEVKGFSKAFSYTGNNSTDGTFVYLGFRPAWVMIKMTNTTGNWTIEDNKRDSYNVNQYRLYPNLSNAEASSTDANIDFLSNGFKIRTVDGGVNGSNTFIGFAVAESPFVSSKGVPVCAR